MHNQGQHGSKEIFRRVEDHLWSRAVCPPSLAWAFEDLCSGIPLFLRELLYHVALLPFSGREKTLSKGWASSCCTDHPELCFIQFIICSLGEDDLVCSGFVLGLVHEVGYSRDLSDPTVRILFCLRSSPSSLVSQRSWSGTEMTRGGS
jgi:hypothetical protein